MDGSFGLGMISSLWGTLEKTKMSGTCAGKREEDWNRMGVEICSDCTGIVAGGGRSLRDREPICRQPGGIWKKEKE
jgi:hypothetical protein